MISGKGAAAVLVLLWGCSTPVYERRTNADAAYLKNDVKRLVVLPFGTSQRVTDTSVVESEVKAALRAKLGSLGRKDILFGAEEIFDAYHQGLTSSEPEPRPDTLSHFALNQDVDAYLHGVVLENGVSPDDDQWIIHASFELTDLKLGEIKFAHSFRVHADNQSDAAKILARYVAQALCESTIQVSPDDCFREIGDVLVPAK